jgi:hypothetical protein
MTTAENHLQDLYEVGVSKSMGYLPLRTITLVEGQDPLQLLEGLQAKGVNAYIDIFCNTASGALIAWDTYLLSSLLESNRTTLEVAGWPINCEEFVEKVMNVVVNPREDPKLYELIGRAFADKRFP